jgi:DNA-binding XRE family transcriptional regulator
MAEPAHACEYPACGDVSNDRSSRLAAQRNGETLLVVLGRRLRRLRVERGWSRRIVAARLGVSVEHVEGHERGSRPIEPLELIAYARLFGIRISEFFKDPPTNRSA